jgi:hypothetical protein
MVQFKLKTQKCQITLNVQGLSQVTNVSSFNPLKINKWKNVKIVQVDHKSVRNYTLQ